MKRRLAMLACSGILGPAALTGLPVSPAQATGISDLTCLGADSVLYSPGLLLEPQLVTVAATRSFGLCVSTDPDIRAGANVIRDQREKSCLTLDSNASGVTTFSWNNGETSTFAFSRTASNPVGQAVVTYEGTITGGEFTDDTAVMVITNVTLNLLGCLAPPGVTSVAGTVELAITGQI
jgi:hypothetical protein